ncbi:MAG: DNA-binding transcriptional regulator [Patescibacteria group bacterium]|nr:DNA-binding transcriptional regulator [Patescibacteria group bacterium]
MTRKHNVKRRVALAYPVAVPWMALFMRGVADYGDRHGGWTILTSPPTLAGAEQFAISIRTLRGWRGDGIIAAIGSPEEARMARRLRTPVVNFGGALAECGLPRVMVDHYAIGRLAAEHLLDRGFRRLAYCGIEGPLYSRLRAEGFARAACLAGASCSALQVPSRFQTHATWQKYMAPLERWLRGLKPPVGLLVVDDYRARVIVELCQALGLRVSRDVAVVGVDNDSTVCDFCRPSLTSVSRSAWKNGYEAAAMLDTLMAGEPPSNCEVLIAPDGVVARQSTATMVLDEPHVAAAVQFMCDHLGEPLGIDQVVGKAAISRRQLELRFRKVLHCTPLEYLSRLRVEHAKDLLARPDHVKLETVAKACGLGSTERLRLVFQRVVGQTPTEYRQHIECGAAVRQ